MSSNLISEKTKAALAPMKGKGILGNRTNLGEAQRKGARVQAEKADVFAAEMVPNIRTVLPAVKFSGTTKTLTKIAVNLTKGDSATLRGSQRAQDLSRIATVLNERGIKTARGGNWSSVTVKRVIIRAHKLGLLDGI